METFSPSLDTWTSIFAIAAFQGFFLAILLFTNKKGNTLANRIFALFIFCFALTLSEYVLHWTKYIAIYPYFANWYKPIVFLFGPLLLLYFKSLDKQFPIRWRALLHFIPALFFLINIMPYYFSSVSAKSAFFMGDVENSKLIQWPFLDIRFIQDYLFMAHLVIYGILIIYYLKSKGFWQATSATDKDIIRRRWSRTILALYGGFVLGNVSYYILIRTPYFSIDYDYGISFAMMVFIYVAGFLGLRQPEIFSGELWPMAFMAPKYQNSTLTPQASSSMLEQVVAYVEKNQSFLDNELRLSGLAEQLSVSTHHLSQVINEQMGMSFSDFINSYRIKAAKEMLKNPAYADQYIINIAYEAGFNNKTSFNKAFKKATGLSPSEYRKGMSATVPLNQKS